MRGLGGARARHPGGIARPFALDTDIGTNLDDLLALALVLGSPELDLVGVTTVSGDPAVRSRIARHALDLAGRGDVPVVAGAGRSLSGRAPRWMGHEATLAPGPSWPAAEGATGWLQDTARRHAGRLEIGAIAPLTNLALALRSDPGFAGRVRRVHAMGGGAPAGEPDHNLVSDAVAAAEVVRALDVRLCGIDVTSRVVVDAAGLRDRLGAAAGSPLGRFIIEHAGVFWRSRGSDRSSPHDPLALLAAVRPDLARIRRRPTGVVPAGAREGEVVRAGPERVWVTGILPGGIDEMWRRVRAGAGDGMGAAAPGADRHP